MNLISSKRKVIKESGASLVECALLVALIAIVAMGSVRFLGTSIQRVMLDTHSHLDSAAATSCPLTNPNCNESPF